MKKLSLLAALFCLFLAGAAFAQKDKAVAANFAGTWELDTAKSKLPERMRVESGTLMVMQTEKELTVATDFKRAPRSENPPPPAPPMGDGGGMRPEGNRGMREGGGRGMMGGGNGVLTYSLDGSEKIIESDPPAGAPTGTLKLKAETGKDGKLKLVSNRSFETQMGAKTVKTVDVWELLDGGKTLKITRETETPRGSQSSEMYFTKKAAAADGASSKDVVDSVYRGQVGAAAAEALGITPSPVVKTISGGVLNGKTTSMPQPEYPPAARAVQASGTVNVQITVDEQGQVVSATAVSGHPLLKAAAEKAARSAKFSPTRLSGIPVKVTGVLVYNFIL